MRGLVHARRQGRRVTALMTGIVPAKPKKLRPGSKVRQKMWCDSVKRSLMLRSGEWFLIRTYKSPTAAWTARAIWAPLMPGVEWLASQAAEEQRDGSGSVLYARWPADFKDYGRRAGNKRDRKL